ncbi:helix-turn-helix domain-containing protein [Streptomyces thermodiastaticus]|jgi:AraC-like DNA-binding protein|uniref:AraC-like ligand-binding domain-containing protein n=1 Tax=Streptomyces thermodiastaticus TaxID=44061 RepID=UPI001676F33D|nr:helix-turn-helix domain-containing protein [Streptomyces thermodiastaticus]MCE7551898.1 helix-turn-helix domain-containing protein [Streptomyces thermodiastaticus]GHF79370.1 AraC family transcriptional regulator [Streptomyces thermodiastaticus]
MLVTDFSTDVVAAPERFALFEEVAAQSHMRNRLRSNDQDDFRSRMRIVDLGQVQVSALSYPHLQIARTAKLIRQSDPEVYQINYFAGGEGTISLAGHDTALRTGDLVVMDSSRSYLGDVRALPDRPSHLTVQIPRGLLSLPDRTVRDLVAVPIDTSRGMGAVFARWLADLAARADQFTPADVPTLASVTLDLLTSLLGRCLDAEDTLDPQARRHALRIRVLDHIRQRLADPGLTPESIAAAHHISVRHLYTLFHDQGVTVAALIRQRRLERCRRDLGDPLQSSRSVQEIAARWGFADPAHFSRAFRAAYGTSPREYRHQCMRARRAQKATSDEQG